jgi:hypothetical protein
MQLFKPKQTRQHFSAVDDKRIMDAVGDQAYPNWNQIAELVPGKTGRQCRERFQHYLRPSLVQEPWTPEEDELICALHTQYGSDWARIAQHFGGSRSNNNIKNRWNNHLAQHGRPRAAESPRELPVPDVGLPAKRWAGASAPASPQTLEFAVASLSDTEWGDGAGHPGANWFGDAGLTDDWPLF